MIHGKIKQYREFLLSSTNFCDPEDYIFFSDSDEIPRPELLSNFV